MTVQMTMMLVLVEGQDASRRVGASKKSRSCDLHPFAAVGRHV
jgi:hypothetical protein